MRGNIRTIDIHAKEWFDKVNGNSYFSAEVTVNYGLKNEVSFNLPFQYGYGDHYKDMVFKRLQSELSNKKVFKENTTTSLWRFCNENKIILRKSKKENCLKREL